MIERVVRVLVEMDGVDLNLTDNTIDAQHCRGRLKMGMR